MITFCSSKTVKNYNLLNRAAKVNEVKIFSGLYYIIKRTPTLVPGTLELV